MKSNEDIKYEIFHKKGIIQIAIIDPTDRNIESLKILGKQLEQESRNKPIAFICVFDNKTAADMLGDESDWSKEQNEFYNTHFIASYNRNTNTNLNRFLFIYLKMMAVKK